MSDPGKSSSGGKSLQLMQQRMMAQSGGQPQQPPQQQQPQQQQQQASTSQSTTGASSSAPSNVPIAASKPKGKDFAAMSSRSKGKDFAVMSARSGVGAPTPSAAAPAPSPVTRTPPNASVASTGPASSSGGVSRPKGKDFSAMASRLSKTPTASDLPPTSITQPPQQQHQPQQQQQQQPHLSTSAQAARAAEMQAGARAAAGLPPLERPTATSVTVPPPTIPPPKTRQNKSPQPLPRTSSYQYQSQQQQQQPTSQQQPAATPRSRSIGSAGAFSRSGAQQPTSNTATTRSLPSVPRELSTKTTPAPEIKESRLVQIGVAEPSMAPSLGARIQSILSEIDPTFSLEPAAEEQVLCLVDDFVDKVVKQSIRIAQHRSSRTLDVEDVQMVLAKQWNIVIPGLGAPVMASSKANQSRRTSTSAATNTTAPRPSSTTSSNNKRKVPGATPGSAGDGRGSSGAHAGGVPSKAAKASTDAGAGVSSRKS